MSCRVPVRAASAGHAEASRASSLLSRLRSCRAVAVWQAWLLLGGLGWLLAAGPGPAAGTDVSLSAARRGRGHRDSSAGPARPRRQGRARGAGPGMAGRRRRGDLPHRPPRLPAGGRDARTPGGDSVRRRAAQDDLRKPRGGSRERGSLPRRGERQSHLSARIRPAVTGDGGGAEPSPRGQLDRPRPAAGGWSSSTTRVRRRIFDPRRPFRRRSTGSRRKDTGAPWFSAWTSTRSGRSRAAPTCSRRSSRRAEGRGTGREPLWRLISVAPAGDDLILLSAVGEVLRLGADGALRLVARLPAGHYHRTNLAVGPDGSVYVCGGFHIRQIFRISPSGERQHRRHRAGRSGRNRARRRRRALRRRNRPTPHPPHSPPGADKGPAASLARLD